MAGSRPASGCRFSLAAGHEMTEREHESKLAELDRLLNDVETRMDPDRVWSLLAELSAATRASAAAPG
jgi:hypothetical protein